MEYITPVMRSYVTEIQNKLIAMNRPVIAEMFEATYLNTMETTVKMLDDGSAFVVTGDIPAMWLRDSSAQVRHYLPIVSEDEQTRSIIRSLILRQAKCIVNDPYANAFNEIEGVIGDWSGSDKTEFDNPMAWERKYEIDSLCYPIQLAYLFMKAADTTEHFDAVYLEAMQKVLAVFETEQHHAEKSPYHFERPNCPPTDTLKCGGKGTPVAYTGMTWSGFRPSDDACDYGYLIPSNMFAAVILGYMTEIFTDVYHDDALAARASRLRDEITDGINRYAVYEHPEFGGMYAYETDGMGSYNLMDDANVPSLLSIPYLGWCSADDPLYVNTRRFILSEGNPFYFEGSAAKGIGSPHTPKNYIWHVSLAMQGLTAGTKAEVDALLDLFETTTAGTGLMHEGFHADNPEKFTRPWFAWANSIFAEFVIHTAEHYNNLK